MPDAGASRELQLQLQCNFSVVVVVVVCKLGSGYDEMSQKGSGVAVCSLR